jgi:hypothetical protein
VEESAAEEATTVWRSQSRRATVGGDVEEPATAGCSWTGAGLGLSLLTSVGFPSRRELSS